MAKGWRHKKRGTTYTILFEGRYQCTDQEHDDRRVVVYQDVESLKVWVRPTDEFFDGRFEEVEYDKMSGLPKFDQKEPLDNS